jgi:hypothetical protein
MVDDIQASEYKFPKIDDDFRSDVGIIYPWNPEFHLNNQYLQIKQARLSGALASKDVFTTFDANGQMMHLPFDQIFAYVESGEADYNEQFNSPIEEEESCLSLPLVIG